MAGRDVQTVAAIGCGVIGAGWAARWRCAGVAVRVADPSPEVASIVADTTDRALAAWSDLGIAPSADGVGDLTIHSSIEEAVAGADLVHESVPERLDLKTETLTTIDAAASPDAVVASSTSGFRPTELARSLERPERFLVAHPFNPVYLMPLVEVVAGEGTHLDIVERAEHAFTSIGMRTLRVRREIDAFIADRLLEAVWREALWLVHDGVATTAEIDEAIVHGVGLRWAQMGLFETYRTAGGAAGMRHFLAQFGPALQWPWTKLTDVPEWTDELVGTIASQSDDQSGHRTIDELLADRDRNLVALLSALEQLDAGRGVAAGATLATFRRSRHVN
ncbi:MAG: 3-hydroxyacyl-CoA dehydrogenase NAD-binding domain-containing protein [Actinomycetota bacterium]